MSVSKRMLAVCPLGSGSKGNSYWIEANGTVILVDAGLSFRQLKLRAEEIGRDINQVDHLFITHEHTDHVKGLEVLLKRHKPVIWSSGGTLRQIRDKIPAGVKVRRMNGNAENAGSFSVRSIPVSHDAAEPYSYRFDTDAGAVAVFTDLGLWDGIHAEAVRGCKILVCEANHDPQMLRVGPYPPHLKARIASPLGHLSNDQGASLALEAVRSGTEYVILGHLSEQNNAPGIALDTFTNSLVPENKSVHIEAASQDTPGPWVEI